MAIKFSDFLTSLQTQRKAVTGRPPSRSEVSGVVAGLAETADIRLSRARSLTLQEKEIEQRETLQTERLAESKRQFDENLAQEVRFAEEAQDAAQKASALKGAVGGGVLAAGLGGIASLGAAGAAEVGVFGTLAAGVVNPLIPIVGAIAGFALSESWICTATNVSIGCSVKIDKAMDELKRYAIKNHRDALNFYLKIGPDLTKSFNGDKEFYQGIRTKMLLPITEKVAAGDIEGAYQLYKTDTSELIEEYMPHLIDDLEKVLELDKEAA